MPENATNQTKLKVIGDWPKLPAEKARYRKAVGTVFPSLSVVVVVNGIHATQRAALIDYLNEEREKNKAPLLSQEEVNKLIEEGVDLFFDENNILIRPQPSKMDIVFKADELLQTLESKLRIKFLHATDRDVLIAIKKRGEAWRINPLPRSGEEIKQWIQSSKTSISRGQIYYHNMITGTRWLTYENFVSLSKLPDLDLALQLDEIKIYSNKLNRIGYPEIAFFQADKSFNSKLFEKYDFLNMSPDELRKVYEELKAKFEVAVPPEMRYEAFDNLKWRNLMYSALISHEEGEVADSILRGLSPEYFMQLEWLPGGRFEKGELIFDTIFEEFEKHPELQELIAICDIRVKSFIFNFMREYGDIEYINVARVSSSLSERGFASGHRGVYLTEVLIPSDSKPIVKIIRMQKWDVWGHLNDGKTLGDAMIEAAEYSEYVLDRRLACRQIGMNLPPKILMHRLSEIYHGSNNVYTGQTIWSTYFERDYLPGISTDKIPRIKYKNKDYARAFGRILGKAAAANMIIGRTRSEIPNALIVLFDDGDEIVVEDDNGIPSYIIIGDPTGSFGNYLTPLEDFAESYAKPILKRWNYLIEPFDFMEAYLDGFNYRFSEIQSEYRERRRAFATLFRHRRRHEGGSLAFRWECVLERLDNTNPIHIT
ncbi:MAG TPA: hypothetical protein PLW02_01500, partial [Verrucomicrobiota bacterium]|nr:hypothetical protein [Verrucomicrobiota bacterium]